MAEDTEQVAVPLSLTALPPEILSHICSFFCRHCTGIGSCAGDWENSKSVRALRLTSKRLSAISRPYLYHVLGESSYDLFTVAETLFEKPDLAAQIRAYSWCEPKDLSFFKQHQSATLVFIARCKGMTDPSDLDFHELINGSELAHNNFIVELIITMATSLERLELFTESYQLGSLTQYRYLASCLAEVGGCTHRPLARLRYLRIGRMEEERAIPLDSAYLVMLLRATADTLEHFFVESASGCSDSVVLSSLPNLRCVVLYACALEPRDHRTMDYISTLCKNSPQLREVHVVGDSCFTGRPRTQITAANILQAVGSRSSALHSLTIDFEQAHLAGSQHSTLPIDALQSMGQLEELRIDSISFCQHRDAAKPHSSACLARFLPVSVKSLSVRMSREYRNWSEIFDFAWQVAAGRFPALRYFRVYSQGFPPHDDLGNFCEELVTTISTALDKVFESTNVDFMVVTTYYHGDFAAEMYECGDVFA